MKIVALIKDGHGRLHLVASRAPDLVRRELSTQTGTAELVWCAVPPQGTGANDIVARALARLGVNSDGPIDLPAGRVIRILDHLRRIEPRRMGRWRLGKSILRQIMGWIRRRLGLAVVWRQHHHPY
jgi:hypothetical protein